MNRSTEILAALALVLASVPALGQEKQDKPLITRGVAQKISEVLGGINVNEAAALELDDLAAAVEVALHEVDPDLISSLNKNLSELKDQEEELISQLAGLAKGHPVALIDEPMMGPLPMEEITAESLELEMDQLRIRELRIKELELQKEKERLEAEAIDKARTTSPLSTALLGTLEDLEEVREAASENVEVVSEFPGRMARALFRTGDFVGALRHFKMIPEDRMEPQDLYEMARCLEELGELQKALPITRRLQEATLSDDAFWHQRGKSLERLIRTALGEPVAQNDGKDT